MTQNAQALYDDCLKMVSETPITSDSLQLNLHDQTYVIQSNSALLIQTLKTYFPNNIQLQCNHGNEQPEAITIQAFETEAFIEAGKDWKDWPRPSSKRGKKDAILDFIQDNIGYRFVFKVKTGMLFLQPAIPSKQTPLLAFGKVEHYPNQIINFILTQSLNQHLRRGALLGHCSAIKLKINETSELSKTFAIAGLSGGGKSTLMLHFMSKGQKFISNDRVLFEAGITETILSQRVLIKGIPKHPRINPGTIVHNANLHSLITEEQKNQFLVMPQETLRQLEHKFDADVDTLYGQNSFLNESTLDALIILNWSTQSSEPTKINQTNLKESPYLLEAIIKSPGPFYADVQEGFLQEAYAIEDQIDSDPYLEMLGNIPCIEVTGRVNFHEAKTAILKSFS